MQNGHFKETINGHTFWMKHIPEGHFDMGDEHGDLWDTCRPVQKDIHIKAFHLAEYPVTQALWKAVMGENNNPSRFKGDQRPVERVSWDDAQAFLDQLNTTPAGIKRHQQDGLRYRLPSEAQWEYAARSGLKTLYAGSNNIKEVGWFYGNSHWEAKNVGLKLPNEWGVYDMSGNVWEWCEDTWIDTLAGMRKDGAARKKEKEILRVIRGGSWLSSVNFCRVSDRNRDDSDDQDNSVGFRFARY